MKNKLNFIAAILALLVFNNSVFAGYNTIDLNTGLDHNNSPATLISPKDPFWQVISPGSPQSSTVLAPVVGWAPPQANSQWLYSGSNNPGFYVYERCFCLKNTEKAVMKLSLRGDDLANIFLNDYSQNVLQTTATYSFAPSRKPAEATVEKGFVTGKNCIRVMVQNNSGQTGFNLVGAVSAFGAEEIADACCRITTKFFTSPAPTKLLTTGN